MDGEDVIPRSSFLLIMSFNISLGCIALLESTVRTFMIFETFWPRNIGLVVKMAANCCTNKKGEYNLNVYSERNFSEPFATLVVPSACSSLFLFNLGYYVCLKDRLHILGFSESILYILYSLSRKSTELWLNLSLCYRDETETHWGN